jgi:hypothetical protein
MELTEENCLNIIDIFHGNPIGHLNSTMLFSRQVVEDLDKIKNNSWKRVRIQKLIIKYFDKHGASCHFWLEKTFNKYISKKETFGLGVIHEIVGKQMKKCGCECNNS